MTKFFSDEYFKELEGALKGDQKWNDSMKGVKTSVLIGATDTNQNYILSVENGTTALQKASAGAQSEFSFEGLYDVWCKVAKGEMDMQSAVLKGQLKFKGSITKLLGFRDRFLRIAELMKSVPKDY
jgi:putative sterol carrier protein